MMKSLASVRDWQTRRWLRTGWRSANVALSCALALSASACSDSSDAPAPIAGVTPAVPGDPSLPSAPATPPAAAPSEPVATPAAPTPEGNPAGAPLEMPVAAEPAAAGDMPVPAEMPAPTEMPAPVEMPPAPTILAATPPMGWNSWNRFAQDVNETVVRQTADAMVSSGMRDAGYVYVNVDDFWQTSRDAAGVIQADPVRFPSGMKALADYVHERGMKLGLYSDRGTNTCGGRPGSYGFEQLDAQTYASWGVDYLKYDNCNPGPGRDNDQAMEEDHTRMGEALRATGRPIVFSICAWWFYEWQPPLGQLWRTTTDITDTWDVDSHSVISLINKNGGDANRYGYSSNANPFGAAYAAPGLAQYASPGHWNDPDMLEVGNGGMTDTEYRSHFSMWAIMAAPLIAGNDIANMTQATKDILLNTEIIAVDQDPLGVQGRPISQSTTLEVWSKRLAGEQTHAVVLFNRTEAPANITVTWQSLGLGGSATVRDLWAHADLGSIANQYTANVPSHGVVVLKVVGTP